MVDGRGVENLDGRAGIAVRPLQDYLLVLGYDLGEALEGREADVAGALHVALLLRTAACVESPCEIVVAAADQLEGLVGGGIKSCATLHNDRFL